DVRVYSLGSCWAFSSTGAIEGINAIEENKVVSIDGYNDVAKSDSALLCAIVKQPISAAYSFGIYDGDCSSNPDDIDHAILIVGYGSEGDEDYWIWIKGNETTGAVITWNSKSSDKGPDGQTLGTYGSATVGLILIFSVPPRSVLRIQWLQCLVEMECKQWH
ncbi:hypothetical protein S83_065573, partial [Arachis hypogaea]